MPGDRRSVTLSVLIVDDDPGFRAAAAELLVERGFVISGEASDATQAVHIVSEGCPDGVLLDMNLSGTDGLAVATMLAEVCSRSRIVLTSAVVDQLPAELLESSAAAAFVSKDELGSVDLRTFFLRPEGK